MLYGRNARELVSIFKYLWSNKALDDQMDMKEVDESAYRFVLELREEL